MKVGAVSLNYRDGLGLEPVIDARYGLAAFPDALDHLDRGPFGKVVVALR